MSTASWTCMRADNIFFWLWDTKIHFYFPSLCPSWLATELAAGLAAWLAAVLAAGLAVLRRGRLMSIWYGCCKKEVHFCVALLLCYHEYHEYNNQSIYQTINWLVTLSFNSTYRYLLSLFCPRAMSAKSCWKIYAGAIDSFWAYQARVRIQSFIRRVRFLLFRCVHTSL